MLSSFSHNNFTHACAAYVYAISKFKQKSNQVKKEKKKSATVPIAYQVHKAPAIARFGKGFDVRSLTLQAERLFRDSNPWPPGSIGATLPLGLGLPFQA